MSAFLRRWVAAVVVAAVSVTVVSAGWHVGHEAEPDCAVCKLRHQPFDEATSAPQVQRLESRAHLIGTLTDPQQILPRSSTPARGPPVA